MEDSVWDGKLELALSFQSDGKGDRNTYSILIYRSPTSSGSNNSSGTRRFSLVGRESGNFGAAAVTNAVQLGHFMYVLPLYCIDLIWNKYCKYLE